MRRKAMAKTIQTLKGEKLLGMTELVEDLLFVRHRADPLP
jgi:hypothetical protein